MANRGVKIIRFHRENLCFAVVKCEGHEGFTLVELLLALFLGSLVLLMATQGIFWFAKQAQGFGDSSVLEVNTRNFNSQFLSLIENSNIAVEYQHLPIKTGPCLPTEPCLRQLSNNQFVDADLSAFPGGAPSAIEFFRDENAQLDTSNALGGLTGTQPSLQSSTMLQLSDAVLAGAYYVTWPLDPAQLGSTTTSPPLMILNGGRNSLYFSLENTAGYTPPFLQPGGYAIFKASESTVTAADLVGQLFLVYNSSFPKHYIVQWITDAVACVGNNPPCDIPSPETLGTGYFALKLSPIGVNSSLSPYIATSSDLGLGSSLPTSLQWWPSVTLGQDPSLYSFPTNIASTYVTGSLRNSAYWQASEDSSDLRKLAGYYHENSADADEFLGVLVQATSYYLKKTPPTVTGENPTYQLMSRTFRISPADGSDQSSEATVLDHVTGKIQIARKLGSSAFNVFIWE